jgi:putative flippase GtrA
MHNANFGKQSLRFLSTGILNTAFGFAIIWGFLATGVTDIAANLAGYGAGLCLSFFVNRRWTFEQTGNPNWKEIFLFGISFAAAYSANFIVILIGQSAGFSGSPLMHLAGVAVYTSVFFMMSKTFVYTSSRSVNDTKLAMTFPARWPEYAVLLLISALLCYFLTLRLTHDVSWQFWIARQMLAGVPLYTHIMEINPPLWFWMALPLEQLGSLTGVAPDRFYIAMICAMAVWTSLVTGRLVFEDNAKHRFILMIAIVIFCLIAPVNDFGQREQIAILLAIPYCALLFKRVQDEPVALSLAVAIGVTAAIGFALKHYFVLVPIALEIWLLWHKRNIWQTIRGETLALGLLALSYVAAIIVFSPDFFRLIVPMVTAAYHGYEKSWFEQLARIEVIIWVFAAVSYPLMRKKLVDRDRKFGDMLAISALAFSASYFLQQKGWQYHAIPATVCVALLMVHCFTNQKHLAKAIVKHPAAFLAAILFLSVGVSRGPYDSEWAKTMDQLLVNEEPGSSVMIFTFDPRRVFPFVEEHQLVWPSRHFAHWMLSGIAQAQAHHHGAKMTPELANLATLIRKQAVDDMKCHPPSLILFQIRNNLNNGPFLNPKRFYMTAFFRRDPAFRDYLANNYRLEAKSRTFESYRRTTPLRIEGQHCYQISSKLL